MYFRQGPQGRAHNQQVHNNQIIRKDFGMIQEPAGLWPLQLFPSLVPFMDFLHPNHNSLSHSFFKSLWKWEMMSPSVFDCSTSQVLLGKWEMPDQCFWGESMSGWVDVTYECWGLLLDLAESCEAEDYSFLVTWVWNYILTMLLKMPLQRKTGKRATI
jgi:hypothetical protein